ncbi:MAG: apolipoprotein N-acyltransferase [Planctomycetota bacterium]|nr:apolipoprotein N-acyltransferase [Planctomycetota bacterium]
MHQGPNNQTSAGQTAEAQSAVGGNSSPPVNRSERLSRRSAMAVVGGVCVPLSFDPWGLASLLPVAIWLLARSLDGLSWRRSLFIGWIFGLAVGGLSFPWLGTAVTRYLGIFVLGDPDSLWALLAGVAAFLLWWPLAAVGWGLLGATIGAGPASGSGRWLLAGLSIVVLESWWPRVFPWSLGSALATPEPTLGWWCLSHFGVEGISMLLVLSGFMAASAGPAMPAGWRHSWRWLAALLWIVAPLLSWSSSDETRSREILAGETMVVSLVQPAIPLETRHGDDAQVEQLETLKVWIERAEDGDGRDADLVILPEAILPGVWRDGWLTAWLDPWLSSPLVVGFTRVQEQGYSNSVGFFSGQRNSGSTPGVPSAPQWGDKKMLVPFGERIPLAGLLSALGIDLPLVELIAAEQQTVFRSEALEAPLGVSICYEGILADPVAETVERGAQWHVNLTEDLWYGDWIEPAQHLQLQRSRAIESQLLWLRCANAGISAIIDPAPQGIRSVGQFRRWKEGRWSPWQAAVAADELRLEQGERSILQARIERWPVPSSPRWSGPLRWGALPSWLLLLGIAGFRKKKA